MKETIFYLVVTNTYANNGDKGLIAINKNGDYFDGISVTLLQHDKSSVLTIGGDVRKIDLIRHFWQVAIETIDSCPNALWINFTHVSYADTKLAACIIALLRRAMDTCIQIYIIGSKAVCEVLNLCKFPELKQFTQVA